jgi:hypothetical protein
VIAVIGAALAISVALWTYFRQLKLGNLQAVRNLADDLSMRRAFVPVVPIEGLGGDSERCFLSVQAAQQRIAQIRDDIAPDHELRAELQQLVLACVIYKSRVDVEPERWISALMCLRNESAER